MRELAQNIWVHEDRFKLMGSPIEVRMTVVKLNDGSLWLHSPTPLNDDIQSTVDNIGKVEHIVAASNGHNNWICQWQSAYPDAKVYLSAGIPKKINIENYTIMEDDSGNYWADDFDHAYMPVNFFNEHIFLHKSSKSLIVTDLVHNYADKEPKGFQQTISKWIFNKLGFKGLCTAPPLNHKIFIKNRSGFKEFIARILSWDFDKIIITHGDIIDKDANTKLKTLCAKFID